MAIIGTGEKAPAFEAQDQHGNIIELSVFRGKKVILYFYPKDNTPGCTAEACNLRDNYGILQSKGLVILGVSPDGLASHLKFSKKLDLPFSLITDEDKSIITSYGVWGPKKFMGKEYEGVLRTTFVISEEGIIEKVIEKVKTKDHSRQILDEMGM